MVTILKKFQEAQQNPAIVDFFSLLFEKAGIRVVDTGEEFSCYHRGTHINFESPLDETSVDYVLDLNIVQVEQILQLVDSREVDEVRQYKILHTLFAFAIDASVNPFHCLKAASNSSTLLSNSLLRRLFRMENVIHVYLLSPIKGDCDVGHTLVFVNKEWSISSGIHGNSGRIFRLTVGDALDFHKSVFDAIKMDSRIGWIKFARWYLTWRRKVSEK